MPISDRNLGKYKVPGIKIVEVNDSIIQLPIQEVLINLVPGFSKKGPFNKPILVNNSQEFEGIFGTVDKYLENKGSYFHRTVETMLSQGPVWALNLLSTSPTRDKLKWKSISVASQYDNGPLISSPYERFFNRQDFWERDDESFNDIVVESTYLDKDSGAEDDDRLFHITNMSDKTITVFMLKSSATGFDVTAESWYGGRDKVPMFMNSKDWISDYMVSVLVINGDWTNYDDLSADATWGSFFNTSGLLKGKLEEFANNRLVTTLAFYDASLIPNFKDFDGRDMYIKNIVNNDTDKTGLFCTYNESELLSSDYYKGKIDLLGQTLVGLAPVKTTIDFLSYNTTINETVTFDAKELNSVGNVFGNYGTGMTTDWVTTRNADYTNWYTNGINYSSSASTYQSVTSSDGTYITLSDSTDLSVDDVIYFNKNFSIVDKTTAYYIKSNDGSTDITISTTVGGASVTNIVSGTTTDIAVYKIAYDFVTPSAYYNLGGYRYDVTGTTLTSYLNPFTINNSASTYSRYDVLYLTSDTTVINTVTGTQSIGTSPTLPNYILNNESTLTLGWTYTKYTNGVWTQSYSGVTVDSNGYMPLNSTYISTSGGTDAGISYLDITFDGTNGSSSDWTNYTKLRSLKIYSELSTNLSLGKGVIIKQTDGYKFATDVIETNDATRSSDAYIRVYFDDTEDPYNYVEDGYKFLFYYIDDEFVVADGNVTSIITTNAPLTTEGVVAKYSSLYLSYLNGNINNGDYIWTNNDSGSTQEIWLKMYLDGSDNMIFSFEMPAGTAYKEFTGFDTSYNSQFIIYSDKANWKQTVEIDAISGTDLTNTTEVYVNKTRYSEITKGSFLEAYYDTSYYDTPGAGYIAGAIPKKFVRVVGVTNDTVDTTLKILTTDGPIKVSDQITGTTSTEYFTTSYSTIDTYVTEYRGVSIDPFIVHADSIPNGTEARQSSILDVIEDGTRLFKGLSNKNRITWRYLVDPFGLGLIANSKQQFVDLCGTKLNSLGFISMPSAREFKKSSNPSFINSDYSVNMEFVKEGADSSKNPDFYYSFGEGVGQSCVSYWFPYIKTDEEGQKFIPPAAEMAKTYMGKFTTINASLRPWTILGGVVKGRLSNVKETEIRFTNDDLKPLHEMGSNPIDYIQNYGYILNSDNTAQSYPYSSLSLIHSREVLIELENRLYDMLLNYHWRFNTPEIRAEIKFRADQICKEFKEADGLYNYRNVCDKTNNTDYIINLQMGVLDTYVEIIKGMGIIINQITILNKGALESSGFAAQ